MTMFTLESNEVSICQDMNLGVVVPKMNAYLVWSCEETNLLSLRLFQNPELSQMFTTDDNDGVRGANLNKKI